MNRNAQNQDRLIELAEAWFETNRQEDEIRRRRREIEAEIKALMRVSRDPETAHVAVAGPYTIKVAPRPKQVVDTDLVFKIAYENALTKYLPQLFFWDAEVSKEGWRRTDERITKLLEPAISTKYGRPELSIVQRYEPAVASKQN